MKKEERRKKFEKENPDWNKKKEPVRTYLIPESLKNVRVTNIKKAKDGRVVSFSLRTLSNNT